MRQVRALARRVLPLAVFLAAPVRANEIEYSAYYVWDEFDNTVATTSFSMAKNMWQRTLAMLDVELDQVTFPATDGVSGASRPQRRATREFSKSRGQILAGVQQDLGSDTRASGTYYFSQEEDYGSQAVSGSLSQDLFQKNLTLSLQGQYTWDQVGEITSLGELKNEFKETHQASLSATQLLSPTTILRLGGNGIRHKGLLKDPYRAGLHPDERWRQAAWGEIRQFLRGLDGSLILNYRYYWDDWELESHTVKLKLSKYLNQDWVFSPWYRYHIQNGVYFAGTTSDAGEFNTMDPKLLAMESNTFGADVTWYMRSLGRKRPSFDFLAGASASFLYFYYFNTSADPRFPSHVVQSRINFAY